MRFYLDQYKPSVKSVNTNGDEIEETKMFQMWCGEHTDEERDMAISLLLDHFNLEIVRTNATKHGTTEMVLRKQETT